MRSKEQKRSDYALQQLNPFMNGTGRGVDKDLATFIVGTPTMILQNGFGQTMAFLLAKCEGKEDSTNKHYFIFKAIAGWSHIINSTVPESAQNFFQVVSNLEQQKYLTLQEEALKMLQWLKRYAKAFQRGE